MKLSPISNTRTADPQRQGSGRGKFVPQTSAGGANISAPLSLRPAGAIGVSDKKTKVHAEQTAPNLTRTSKNNNISTPQGSNSNPKGIIQENNILYNSGNR